MGLELTATPFVETSKGPVQFQNVIYDYPLALAMEDGFVKEPAVVTQKNFDPKQFTPEQIERIKLEDGIRLHENTKVELETYARQTGRHIVKPFMLIEQSIGRGLRLPDGSEFGGPSEHCGARPVSGDHRRGEPSGFHDSIETSHIGPGKEPSENPDRSFRIHACRGHWPRSDADRPGVTEKPDIAAIVAKTVDLVVSRTIDIPRILVVPKGDVTVGFTPFKLDCGAINFQPVERDLLIRHLRTHEQETLGYVGARQQELRPEDYIVYGLTDYDDVSYDERADLLYDLAGQMVAHLRSYLSDEDALNVLIYHQKKLAAFIHAQMLAHQWEKATDYEVVVSKGFTELRPSAFTSADQDAVHDFRETVAEKSRITQMLFGGFKRGLYRIQKFQSDSERKLAVILDRESEKWFKPALGQFQIFYKSGTDHPEYVPDFVAETESCIYLLEPKARNDMTDADVLAKKDTAVKWCAHASTHAEKNGGKPWKYLLIPHDAITANMTLSGLASQFLVTLGEKSASCLKWSGRLDLNQRLLRPERSALPG